MRRLGVVAAVTFALATSSAGTASGATVAPAVPLFAQPQYEMSIPPSPAYVTNMVVADFTGDGLDDVLVALGHWPTTEEYPVVLLVNDGAGHLVDRDLVVFQGHIPVTVFPYKWVVADFNGDKVPDVFIADTGEDVANPSGAHSPLILSAPGGHLVDGTPNLPQQRAYTYYTDAADVNGDGTIDLYLGNTQTMPPEILLNDGHGNFHISPGALPAAIDPPANVTCGRFADVNGDGAPDLIVAGADYSSGAKTFRVPLQFVRDAERRPRPLLDPAELDAAEAIPDDGRGGGDEGRQPERRRDPRPLDHLDEGRRLRLLRQLDSGLDRQRRRNVPRRDRDPAAADRQRRRPHPRLEAHRPQP